MRKKNLLRLRAAAELVGLSPKTLRRFIAEGELKAYRVGKSLIYVDEQDVLALIRAVPNGADS
ncbi:helix-turn-helix transcriptional regulator [Lolliginicoccus suaedae]|uniref:helix-turn-helix transcriptional regulator n=1 Tax=Lolliginicoccus suaedae TaxID=2605429 RepID=UPI001F18B116|nr:helix-turn-helix domain-containing protein [Lolliginicoccus suaedae]